MTEPFNSFEMAQSQFDAVAATLELDAGTRSVLRSPLREYSFAIPVPMDDGRVKVFRGSACSTTTRAARAGAASSSTPWRRSTPCGRSPCG